MQTFAIPKKFLQKKCTQAKILECSRKTIEFSSESIKSEATFRCFYRECERAVGAHPPIDLIFRIPRLLLESIYNNISVFS